MMADPRGNHARTVVEPWCGHGGTVEEPWGNDGGTTWEQWRNRGEITEESHGGGMLGDHGRNIRETMEETWYPWNLHGK